MMRSSSGGSGGSSSNTTTTSCQDCGNKAKRDCEHSRCRTCCKSRGFQCGTHVKSTWVPVARRRQKQLQQPPPLHQHRLSPSSLDHYSHYLPLPLSLSNIHHHTPTSTSPGLEGGNFPAEVNSSATFRCIRVSSEDNVVDQYAYQTSITIGGHVFKGVLYDQGPTTTARRGGEGSSIDSHHFNLTTTATSMAATHQSSGGANVLYHPSSSLYSAPTFNAFLPGMQFFPHPRP